jgi:hypothetical protein
MKSMVAFGQKPDAIIFMKFTETNRAIGAVYQAISSLILINRDRSDSRLFKPNCDQRPGVI